MRVGKISINSVHNINKIKQMVPRRIYIIQCCNNIEVMQNQQFDFEFNTKSDAFNVRFHVVCAFPDEYLLKRMLAFKSTLSFFCFL